MDWNNLQKDLEARGFSVRIFDTGEAAADYLTDASQGKTVGFGGSMTLELPKGQKLEEITWKDDAALWYLTRPMRDDEKPERHTFKADTEWGVFEVTVTIIESR